MSTLYGYGYDPNHRLPYGQLLTKEQLLAKTTVAHMDPEFRRRILTFIEASPVMVLADGRRYYSLTLGESWRDTTAQAREFLRRHYLDPLGALVYLGQRYSLLPGMSPLAPPGSSYHESSDLEDESLAADLFGNNLWANVNCARFGLMNFRATGLKPEAWHHQPLEIPTARRLYKRSNLPVWNLPGTPAPAPPGDDDMAFAIFQLEGDNAAFYGNWDGKILSEIRWSGAGARANETDPARLKVSELHGKYLALGVTVVKLNEAQFRDVILKGEMPYETFHAWNANSFHRHLPNA